MATDAFKRFRPGAHIPNVHESGTLDADFPSSTVELWINVAGTISAALWATPAVYLQYTVIASQSLKGNFKEVRTHADTSLTAGQFHVMSMG